MIIQFWDYVLLCFQLPISWLIIKRASKNLDENLQNHFRLGIVFKLAACIILGLIYQYYYGEGDTLAYFVNSKYLTKELLNNPSHFFDYLFSSADEFKEYFKTYINQRNEGGYYFETANITIVKIAAICNIFSLNSFFGTGFIFCFFAYSGLWKLFTVFYKAYTDIGIKFVLILYIPSVIFWGSGILKDPVCMGCVGWIIYFINTLTFSVKKNFVKIGAILICFYLIYLIKTYILFCLAIPLFIWLYMIGMKFINKKLGFSKTLLLNAGVIFLAYRYGDIKQRVLSIDTEKLYLSMLQIRSGFENTTSEEGSSFSLGEFEPTIGGFLSQVPKSINAVLFRPYIWEAKKIFSLIAALESTVFFICTIVIILQVGIKTSLKCLRSNADLLFCLLFTFLFAAALGITVSNFGTLVRFKIQFMPFFVIGLLLLKYKKLERTAV